MRFGWWLSFATLASCSWDFQFFGAETAPNETAGVGGQAGAPGREGGAPGDGGSGDVSLGEGGTAGAGAASMMDDCPDGPLREWFQDADGDGFGDFDVSEFACDEPFGFVDQGGDCADVPDSDPDCAGQDGALCSPEFSGLDGCDEIDTDCDGELDEDCFPELPPASTGLLLWLDGADVDTFEPGGPIGLWRDKSGGERHAAQLDAEKSPTHVVAGANGRGVLRFDGQNDSLMVDNSGGDFDVPNLTVLTVLVLSGTEIGVMDLSPFSIRGSDISETRITLNVSSDLSGFSTHDGIQAVKSNVALDVGRPYLFDFSFQGSSAEEHYLNGQFISAHLHGPNVANMLRPLTVGAAQDGVDHFAGDVGELVVFGRTLLPAERRALLDYFSAKWGILAEQ